MTHTSFSLPQRMIVTGAQSGIGRAVAQAAVDAGGTVLGIDRHAPSPLAEPVPSTNSSPGRFIAQVADVTDAAALDEVFGRAAETLGGAPDAVVHCAGIYRQAPVGDMSLDEWEHSMRTNSTSSFLVARGASRIMTGGSLVLLTSIAYARGDWFEPCAAYAASKGAVVSLTTQLAAELGPRGIRVNAVAPGVINTPMTTITQHEHATAGLLQRLPLRRVGEASEVAAACLFLSSAAASYITGAVLPVDGGFLVS
ncbi:SDR family NAD(P)-dependent oxidoreductase [Leucobacter sp. W1478]|uniref:SDR family NAD(P)-dependent oxidoreductase n=1 Tax=Leucobacter sp. W1478 TaxID=3439065 RepID=UPI003F33EBB7